MRFLSLLLLALLVSANVQAKRMAGTSLQEAPRLAAQTFYHWVLTSHSWGLPSAKEMLQLKPMLSRQVVELIETARGVEQQCIRNTSKGDKPSVIEGSLLVGNYEGADEVVIGEPQVRSAEAKISARFFIVDSRFPKAHPNRVMSWTDQLLLRFDGTSWQVVDITFEEKTSLTQSLKDYIAENKDCSDSK